MTAGNASDSLERAVFAALADGAYHSGAALAEQQGVTRGGIWKAIEHLRERGLPIEAAPNRGYRLPAPVAPLAAAAIRARLPVAQRTRLAECAVLWETASTNSLLLEAEATRPGMLRVLLAENQHGGRGRRGRAWQAALGGSLCLSLGFGVEALPRDFGAVTLAMGIAALDALKAAGVQGIALKWPNDLVHGSRKVGGILTEMRAEAGGPAWVVCGIGLNIGLAQPLAETLRAQGVLAGDLVSLGLQLDRNALAAGLIAQVIEALDLFLQQGLEPFLPRWRDSDALFDRDVSVSGAAGLLHGRACGIDASGALRLRTASGEITVIAGDVSVRAEGTAA